MPLNPSSLVNPAEDGFFHEAASLSFDSRYPDSQRWVFLLEYQGTAFCGSQSQETGQSVQEALERALDESKLQRVSRVSLSSRTDSGVSAHGQVAHVDIVDNVTKRDADWVTVFNYLLPDTLSIKAIAKAVPTPPYKPFLCHASARWRWYRYQVFQHRRRTIWQPPVSAWVRYPLDVEAMQHATSYLLGQHDFASFRAANAQWGDTVCNLIQCQLSADEDRVWLDIVSNRFVYRMVRNIMGTLIEIGRNPALPPDHMRTVLEAKKRSVAGPCASPQGLSLMAVGYQHPWDFFKTDVYVKKLEQCVQEWSREQREQNIRCKTT